MGNAPQGLFNMAGVIPPIDQQYPTSDHRSPYLLKVVDFIKLFSFTKERIEILNGLLNYRAELYKVGVISGFQWLDGSFATDIENLEQRPPNDIDVVTFFDLPGEESQKSFFPKIRSLIDPLQTKSMFKVDAYSVVLGSTLTPPLIQKMTYWYSMWSHRKSDNMWKGFIKLDLSPSEDEEAIKLLKQLREDM